MLFSDSFYIDRMKFVSFVSYLLGQRKRNLGCLVGTGLELIAFELGHSFIHIFVASITPV